MCRQVAVQWTTNQQAAGAVVQYGTASGQYTGSATATFDTYTRTDMCGGEAATTGYLFPGTCLPSFSVSHYHLYTFSTQNNHFSNIASNTTSLSHEVREGLLVHAPPEEVWLLCML